MSKPYLCRTGALAVTALLLAASLGAPAPVAVAASTGAVITVTTLATAAVDGACSFDEALAAVATQATADACAGDPSITTVDFAPGLTGQITLASDLTPITRPLLIDGGGRITVDGAGHQVLTSSSPDLEIDNLTITGGSGAHAGGLASTGTSTLEGVTFVDNAGADAGAVWSTGPLTVVSSHFTGNAGGSGAGAIASTGTLNVQGSTFSGNTGGGSGAIAQTGSSLVAYRTTFSGNSGTTAGAVRTVAATTTLTADLFTTNSGSSGGGAVHASGAGTVTISSSTFAANQALTANAVGGSIWNESGSMDLFNATITGGSADKNGGGVFNGGTLHLGNTIVAGNAVVHPGAGAGIQVAGTLATDTANIVAASTTGLLDPAGPADHGGPTKTIALPHGSPAIDAADTSVCGSPPVDNVDQRGLARDPGKCDVGAYERDNAPPSITVGPTTRPRAGASLTAAGIPILVTWAATDTGNSGLHHYRVETTADGTTWTTAVASATGLSATVYAASGSTTGVRVTPYDGEGNEGTPVAATAAVKPALMQQTYSGITYLKTWKTSTNTSFSGGTARWSAMAGASARITFTGRGAAVIMTRGPARGIVTIFVNGTKTAVVDLSAAAYQHRVVVWQKQWLTTRNLSIKLIVAGTAGRPRVDLDAFVELK